MLTTAAATVARAELARLRAAQPTAVPGFAAARLARVAELEAQLATGAKPTPSAPDVGLARWDATQLATARRERSIG